MTSYTIDAINAAKSAAEAALNSAPNDPGERWWAAFYAARAVLLPNDLGPTLTIGSQAASDASQTIATGLTRP